MASSVDIANALLDKVRLSKLYTVELPVPANFRVTGFIPYDMSITDGIASIKIPASSAEEAESFGKKFLGIEK